MCCHTNGAGGTLCSDGRGGLQRVVRRGGGAASSNAGCMVRPDARASMPPSTPLALGVGSPQPPRRRSTSCRVPVPGRGSPTPSVNSGGRTFLQTSLFAGPRSSTATRRSSRNSPTAVASLSEQQRAAVLLVHGYGYSFREAADVLRRVAVDVADPRRSRIGARLRSHLEVHDESPTG